MSNFPITPDISDSVMFFQRVFVITIALALGESFKQFVADESKTVSDDYVHYNRIPPLLTFIFLIMPFFQGMNRYFYFNYLRHGEVLTIYYPAQISFDALMFLAESAVFFIMSRALRLSRLRSFANYIIVLMLIDTTWSLFASLSEDTKLVFISLNSMQILVAFAVRYFVTLEVPKDEKSTGSNVPNRTALQCSIFLAIASCAVFFLGYYLSWKWYFPTTENLPSKKCDFMDLCKVLKYWHD